MKFKKSAFFSIILVLSLLLSACSSNSKSATSQQKVTITYYLSTHTPQAGLQLMTNDIVPSFEKKYPNIHVKVVKLQDPTATAKQQLAAGGGPDIVALNGPMEAAQFASAGYIIPIDKYVSQFKWQDRYFDWSLKAVNFKGKQYALPGSFETMLVYYNKDLFEKNGWSVPTNYQELMDLGQKMKDKKIIPFAFGNSDLNIVNEWWLTEAFNETLGAPAFQKVLKGETAWNTPEVTEAVQKYNDMWQKGYISDKKSQAITLDASTTLFNNQQAAMTMQGTWFLSTLITNKPSFNVGMFQMPAWKDGVTSNLPIGIGAAYGINAHSKNADAAAKFLDWLDRPEFTSKEAEDGDFRPVKSLKMDDKTPASVKDAFTVLNDALNKGNVGYTFWTYIPPKTDTYAWGNLDSVLLKQIDIKTYMDNLQKNFEEDKKDGNLFNFSD